MSESSLPPFGPAKLRLFLRSLRPGTHLKEALRRLRGRDDDPVSEPDVEPRAAKALSEYLDAHAAILERATRLEKKAERLEKAGTPSESARNRAGRARGEILAGLATLRASFTETAGEHRGARAFDRALEPLYPALAPHHRPDRQSL
jgi:hypothetical protein